MPSRLSEQNKTRSPVGKRKNAKRACDHCRQKKVRCQGSVPCKMCIKHGIPCTFQMPRKKRGPKPKHSLPSPAIRHVLTNAQSTSPNQLQLTNGVIVNLPPSFNMPTTTPQQRIPQHPPMIDPKPEPKPQQQQQQPMASFESTYSSPPQLHYDLMPTASSWDEYSPSSSSLTGSFSSDSPLMDFDSSLPTPGERVFMEDSLTHPFDLCEKGDLNSCGTYYVDGTVSTETIDDPTANEDAILDFFLYGGENGTLGSLSEL